MTSDMKGSVFAFQGNDFARNAAFALDLLIAERIAERNRDKAVARMFGVSLRMAKYLREGKHWTWESTPMQLVKAEPADDQMAVAAFPDLAGAAEVAEAEPHG